MQWALDPALDGLGLGLKDLPVRHLLLEVFEHAGLS